MRLLKQKKGFSLIEILLVLGITLTLAVSAFFLYARNDIGRKADVISKEIISIAGQYQNFSITEHGLNFINEAGPFDKIPKEILDSSFPVDIDGNYVTPIKTPMRLAINPAGGNDKALVIEVGLENSKDPELCNKISLTPLPYSEVYTIRIDGLTVFDESDNTSMSEFRKNVFEACDNVANSPSNQSSYIQFWIK